MTTINNEQSLIEKVGGIERAKEIVEGAPANINYRFYSLNVGNGNSGWHVDFRSDCIDMVDLRTAIAKHDTTDHVTTQLCIGCGSTDLYKGGEIKEPKMCLDCFAEMVGFTRTCNGFIESDEVTDIRNHVSPSTKVIDHG